MFLPTAVLAVMKSVCLQGFPWPARFNADTLNVYSRPSIRPVQVYWVALTTDSLAFTHRRLFLSFFSMQYPVMGEPPSLLGRSQDRMTKSLLILLIWRFRGSLGGSEWKTQCRVLTVLCHACRTWINVFLPRATLTKRMSSNHLGRVDGLRDAKSVLSTHPEAIFFAGSQLSHSKAGFGAG